MNNFILAHKNDRGLRFCWFLKFHKLRDRMKVGTVLCVFFVFFFTHSSEDILSVLKNILSNTFFNGTDLKKMFFIYSSARFPEGEQRRNRQNSGQSVPDLGGGEFGRVHPGLVCVRVIKQTTSQCTSIVLLKIL